MCHSSTRNWAFLAPWPALLLATSCSGDRDDAVLGAYDPPAALTTEPSATVAAPPPNPAPPPTASGVAPEELPVAEPASETVYDPSVDFDWPETVPSGPCLAGVYSGEFSCQIDLTGGLFPPGVYTGPVTFTLEQAASGEFLEITDGTLQGITGFIQFSAELAGQLDCTTNQFTADAVNGVYPGGTFSGVLDGNLDRATQTLTGTWSMTAMGFPPCFGPWSVTRQP